VDGLSLFERFASRKSSPESGEKFLPGTNNPQQNDLNISIAGFGTPFSMDRKQMNMI